MWLWYNVLWYILRNFSEHLFYRTPPDDCLWPLIKLSQFDKHTYWTTFFRVISYYYSLYPIVGVLMIFLLEWATLSQIKMLFWENIIVYVDKLGRMLTEWSFLALTYLFFLKSDVTFAFLTSGGSHELNKITN